MSNNKPTFIAYSVKDRGRSQKPFFVRIGGAWPFESGKPGFTIQLDALPIDGRIILAEPKTEDADTAATAEAK